MMCPHFPARGTLQERPFGKDHPFMCILLFSLAQTFWPDYVMLIKQVEIHAAIMALGVFGFILVRLWRHAFQAARVVS